jgi:hypothetical protein
MPTQTEKEAKVEFPNCIMSGVAKDFVDLHSPCLESPPQFGYMAFLTCLGSLVSNRLTLETGLKPQPRLYTLLLGPSGASRKSTVMRVTIDFFKSYINGIQGQGFSVCSGVGSDIGLLEQLKDFDKVLLHLDEFKQLTSKSGIQGSNLLPCIASLFDNSCYENRTKNEHIKINDSHLSILAASTPETYESTWDPEFTNIGLNNRLFIVPGEGERGDGFPPVIQVQRITEVQMKLHAILRHVGQSMTLGISGSAKGLHSEWYQNLETSVYAQRLEAYALRLMCLIAVNDLKSEVDDETVKTAIALCDWQLEMRKLYTPVDADNTMARMEEKIRRQLETKGKLTRRELSQYTNAGRSGIWYFDKALSNLEKSGEITREEVGRTKTFSLVESEM